MKPAVRARIERDVADIASGKRTFSEVVSSALSTFQEKFKLVRDGVPKLIEEFDWKRKKWRQWKDSDKVFAERSGKGSTASLTGKGNPTGNSEEYNSDGGGNGKGDSWSQNSDW